MRVLLGFLVLVVVAIVTWCEVFFGYVLAAKIFDIPDPEGASAMGFAFVFAPLVAIPAAVAAMIWMMMRGQRG